MSIRWKITFGLLGLTLVFIGIYVALAKRTFEEDKISYVFEMQQGQVDLGALNLRRELEKSLLDLKTFAYLSGVQSPANLESLFKEEERFVALDATKNGQSVFRFEKNAGVLSRVTAQPSGNTPGVVALPDHVFGFAMNVPDQHQDLMLLRGALHIPDPLGQPSAGQVLFITDARGVVTSAGDAAIKDDDLKALAKKIGADGSTLTRIESLAGQEFLVSRSSPVLGEYFIWALTPKAAALGALDVLYRRSLMFLAFSFFAALAISLLMSLGLTRNINRLTILAERVGQGDFTAKPAIQSSDEIGILSRTFSKMVDEIQKLLKATADNARMEAELKTARVVQDNLFPKVKDAQIGNLRIAGFYQTSSECGGDWWSYFRRGGELNAVIADATGHGTPAALITSAARSIYSHVERSPMSLPEAATLMDVAIHECSSGKLAMTAFLARIDGESGLCSFLNASHEAPVIVTPGADGATARFVESTASSTLGEGRGVMSESFGVLEPGEKMILWTDGLTAMTEGAGKALGEKRFLKQMAKSAAAAKTPAELCEKLFADFHAIGGNAPLIDDVTLVVIENTKKRGSPV